MMPFYELRIFILSKPESTVVNASHNESVYQKICPYYDVSKHFNHRNRKRAQFICWLEAALARCLSRKLMLDGDT